ncbi:hypothetical protein TrVFT333_003845 [Trichoderma virens FT-333]|nr:hypothetical protein TrVFT333_003845 [Trichoderma virens FT-333]
MDPSQQPSSSQAAGGPPTLSPEAIAFAGRIGQSPLAGAVFKKEDEALLEGGADPDYGKPTAMECVTMFNQEDIWKAKFEAAPGRGKGKPPALD